MHVYDLLRDIFFIEHIERPECNCSFLNYGFDLFNSNVSISLRVMCDYNYHPIYKFVRIFEYYISPFDEIEMMYFGTNSELYRIASEEIDDTSILNEFVLYIEKTSLENFTKTYNLR